MVIISHWSHYVPELHFPALQFYSLVDDLIKEREVPKVSITQVKRFESSVFGPQRVYLRIMRKGFVFDICAAQFGTGYFFSWWLGEQTGCLYALIRLIPFIGGPLTRFFWPLTYYKVDTALMFQDAVRLCMHEIIQTILEDKGFTKLSEEQLKPIMRDVFQR